MKQQLQNFHFEKANKVINILNTLMGDEFTRPIDWAIVVGLVAYKIVETCEKLGVDKQDAIDAICMSVKKYRIKSNQ